MPFDIIPAAHVASKSLSKADALKRLARIHYIGKSKERSWPRFCEEHLRLPRITVLAKLSARDRDHVVDYHRCKIMKELADVDTGHIALRGWTVTECRNSLKGRLRHLERVAEAFAEIDRWM